MCFITLTLLFLSVVIGISLLLLLFDIKYSLAGGEKVIPARVAFCHILELRID